MIKSPVNKLTAVLTVYALIFAISASHTAQAADSASGATSATNDTGKKKNDVLEEIVVTGSLIPQLRVQTSTPVTVITAQDIQSHGFANVAEALQRASFSTGSVQGPQYNGGFTPGAQTLSLFGLSPSYVKYLIDGRPLADYPALYNGTDIIANIGDIPTLLVDHLDILPGGQSSIYGSDAIAGVVNIVMKKKFDGPVIDARYGFTHDGGGTERRVGVADSFSIGSLNLTLGGQYERTNPIYGYQRDLTKSYFASGTSPQTAERDFLVLGLFGDANGDLYYFQDPTNCANVSNLYGGSARKYFRPARGNYCGTTNAGYYTIGNGDESTHGYLHLTNDFNEHLQLFADVLVTHAVTTFNTGAGFLGTSDDPSAPPFSYYMDPNLGGDLLNWQRIFSPEEAGGLGNTTSKNTNNSVRGTLGLQGSLGSSKWTYAVDMTFSENKLTERQHMLFTSQINDFFAPYFGPVLGVDPTYGVNIYSPDYAAFYRPITPAQYASFSGYVNSYSRTEESLIRSQLTTTSLFALPGGDAGLALVLEGGRQGWDYTPDPRYGTGETYLYTATAGSGHRTRYAITSELRLPVLTPLTLTASGRYDRYKVSEGTVDKATYNLGLEYYPVKTLLLRGRYGTAFKAPTLSDEYQGQSGYFATLTDYYSCALKGFSGTTLGDCPDAQQSYFGTTSGNTALKPITAKVWDVGLVWKPVERASISVDYIHWDITNEVTQQNADQLLSTESQCRQGTRDITSPTCVAAIAQVTRDANGVLLAVATPKINVSKEKLSALTVGLSYALEAGRVGEFEFALSYSNLLKHDLQQYAGDPMISLFSDPVLSQEFKTKENASITWNKADFSSTFYVEHYGPTPNYLATINGYGTDGAGKLHGWTLCNLSVSYKVLSSLEVSAAANNVFNKMPPADHSYPGTEVQPYNELNYNIFGRTYYLDATYKFGR